jgi:hypothetical protein
MLVLIDAIMSISAAVIGELASNLAESQGALGCAVPKEDVTSTIHNVAKKSGESTTLATIVAELEAYMDIKHPEYTPRTLPFPTLPQTLLHRARYIADKSNLEDADSVEALLERRSVFRRLEPYFVGFNIGDIRRLTEADMLALVKPEDKMVAKLFAKDCLPLIQRHELADSALLRFPGHFSQHLGASDQEIVLNRYPDSSFNIVDALQTTVAAHKRPEMVECVDLSDSYLRDNDIERIIPAIHKLPSLKLLNLNKNRYLGVTDDAREYIRTLLTCRDDVGPVLDVTGSRYLLSIDHRALYTRLPIQAFSRFIFLPLSWTIDTEAADSVCKMLLCDRPDRNEATYTIVATHRKYYKIASGP